MSPSPINYIRRSVRWFLPAALLALTPKCFLCLAAYAGLGAALGLGGPEICGATPPSTMSLWMAAFVVCGLTGFWAHHWRRRHNR